MHGIKACCVRFQEIGEHEKGIGEKKHEQSLTLLFNNLLWLVQRNYLYLICVWRKL